MTKKRYKGMLRSEEVDKVYVGMSKKEELKLKTETCKKCGDLIDDHLKELGDKGKYVCRNCGCEID